MSVQEAQQEITDLSGLLAPELPLRSVDLACIVPDLGECVIDVDPTHPAPNEAALHAITRQAWLSGPAAGTQPQERRRWRRRTLSGLVQDHAECAVKGLPRAQP